MSAEKLKETAPQAARRRGTPAIMPDRVGLAEDKRRDWVVDVPIDNTLEDCLESSYWAHVSQNMEPLDTIMLRAEDGSWVAFLVVRFCERNYAQVVLDRVVKLEGDRTAPEESIQNKVDWKGPSLRYCVIRTDDNQLLHSGCRTKAEAERWLLEHEKALER